MDAEAEEFWCTWMVKDFFFLCRKRANARILFPYWTVVMGEAYFFLSLWLLLTSPLLSFILKKDLNQGSDSDVHLLVFHPEWKCLQTNTSCLWRPWQPITLCGALPWLVICTSRSFGHMVFDYWRWRARLLSDRCVVPSEADTRGQGTQPELDTC